MKAAICIGLALATLPASAFAADEQCRFIQARADREACYQRQEIARAARQKELAAREAIQSKPLQPMAPEDAELARSMRGICRGC